MKKTAFALLAAALAAFAANAEIKIPKSAEEDSGKTMSQKYWDLWNPEVQKKIDADIEANRKADASFKVGEIEKGSKVRVEQISHEFFFGAHIFNFDQLGDRRSTPNTGRSSARSSTPPPSRFTGTNLKCRTDAPATAASIGTRRNFGKSAKIPRGKSIGGDLRQIP